MFLILAIIAALWFLSDPLGFISIALMVGAFLFAAAVTLATVAVAWVALS